MQIVKFLISLLLTIGLCFALNTSFKGKKGNLPPIGKILSPFHGFWQNAPAVNNHYNNTIEFGSIKEGVTVQYDDRMVPHIFAKNKTEGVFAQGYVTAKDRLWQMDISTRAVSGRLAEIMGPKMLERDKLQRRKGMYFAAKNAIEGWKKSPENFKLLQSYADGVNAYIESLSPADYPFEYKLLDYQPEYWTPLKTAFFIKAMAASLCAREADLENSNALEVFGKETFDFLYPQHKLKESPIIPETVKYDFTTPNTIDEKADDSKSRIGFIPHQPIPKPPPFLGSNNWAIAGSKTASGNPILCSDPHLLLSLPSTWYEVQLHYPGTNTYGVSLPGVPGVIIGFNENIAWGITNVGHDVMDWYRIEWENENRAHYMLDGEKVPVKKVVETIKVKGQMDVQDTILYTVWGPVVYEDPDHPEVDLALRWLAHDVPNKKEMTVFEKLNAAKNFDEYAEALSNYETPPQNFAFACKDGTIGLKVQGKFPWKNENQGLFVQEGNTRKNAWKGFISGDQNPTVKNPARGFVSSANQRSTGKDYPYYYNGRFEPYRGRIVNKLLSKKDNFTIEDMKKMQMSNYSMKAEEMLPVFYKHLDQSSLSSNEKSLLDLLKNWNHQFDRDSEAPALFSEWLDQIYKNTWDEIYVHGELIAYPKYWRMLEILEADPKHAFFDNKTTPEIETANEIVTQSFHSAIDSFTTLRNKNGGKIPLHKYRQSSVRHLANIPALSFEKMYVSGDIKSLNAIGERAGPSWRMIVELGDEVEAWGVYPGGQSGNPGSPFYANMMNSWIEGDYYKLQFMKNENDATNILETLKLN